MPQYFIRHVKRFTTTVTLNTIPDGQTIDDIGDEEYLGVVDEDINWESLFTSDGKEIPVVETFGPYATEEEARAADEAWTEWQ